MCNQLSCPSTDEQVGKYGIRGGDGGMAQWVKVIATKSDNLKLDPQIHMVEGETRFLESILCPPLMLDD